MTNIYNDQRKKEQKDKRAGAFDVAEVLNVAPNSRHIIVFSVIGQNTPDTASVLTPNRGDINVPDVGDLVVIGYTRSGVPFVFGTIYAEEDATLEYELSGRRIGHSLTTSRFQIDPDGTIRISSFNDSEVSVAPDGNITVTNTAGSSVRLEGDTVIIDAKNVELAGEGGAAIARVGDPVSVSTTSGNGSITGGSSRVNSN